jgi:hypothetical protein
MGVYEEAERSDPIPSSELDRFVALFLAVTLRAIIRCQLFPQLQLQQQGLLMLV